MALKQIFEYPRTLRSLRIGPLGKLLEGFCSWLLEHGFIVAGQSVSTSLTYHTLTSIWAVQEVASARALAQEMSLAFSRPTLWCAGGGERWKGTSVESATR
ncbi:hypothetical protein ES703_73001 [subsurface metagenome]